MTKQQKAATKPVARVRVPELCQHRTVQSGAYGRKNIKKVAEIK